MKLIAMAIISILSQTSPSHQKIKSNQITFPKGSCDARIFLCKFKSDCLLPVIHHKIKWHILTRKPSYHSRHNLSKRNLSQQVPIHSWLGKGEGVFHPAMAGGGIPSCPDQGVPHPVLVGGAQSCPAVLAVGTPSQPGLAYPPCHGWGYPVLS